MREKTTRAQELASAFALNEKELELARVQSESQRRHLLMWLAIGGSVALLVISLLIFKAYRESVKRQRIAARQIDELWSLHQMTPPASDEDRDDFRLFSDMQRRIIDDELFKQPQFNRDAIIELTGLSRGKVSQLIEKFANLGVNDYINKLRVEYSVQLLKEHPDWTIDAIAESSGYVRRATYYSHFNRVFGITPAQYRKEAGRTPVTDSQDK